MADRRTPQPPRIAGRFSYSIIRRNRPRTLATWRATDTTPRTARHLAKLLGGHPQPDPETGQHEVITTTDTLDIIMSGPEALDIRWQRGRQHTCDGITQCDAQGSRPCTCPAALSERKTIALRGDGCTPWTLLRFQLRKAPELGIFTFSNGTWSFANASTTVKVELQRANRPAVARLRLVRATSAARHEPGVVYTRPALTIVNDRVRQLLMPDV